MFEVMCFGDSNTWGYSPSSGERYPRSVRWTGVLQAALGSNSIVIEEGLNGRTTVFEDPIEGDKMGKRHLLPLLLSHAPLDLVVLMLGSNDLKKRFSAHPTDIAAGVSTLLDIIAMSGTGKHASAPPVLLMAPPPLTTLSTFAGMFEDGVEKSKHLGKLYRELAAARGCAFLDTADVIQSSSVDGLHFDEKAHAILGKEVAKEVKKILR